MIRPASEIEYPPSDALLSKASMLARMESLNKSSKALMSVIAERIGAEAEDDLLRINELTQEQERLIDNMRDLVRS